jgi:hypothetical protein
MSDQAKGSIVLKILIAVLAVILAYVLLAPPAIWKEQARRQAQERKDMLSINQAEKFYKDRFGKYTLDFDSIRQAIDVDTVLTLRKRLTLATQALYYKMQETLNNDLLTHLTEIARSYRDMEGDFTDPEKMSVLTRKLAGDEEKQAALHKLADSLHNVLLSVTKISTYSDDVQAFILTKELSDLMKNIADDRLSIIALKAHYISDTLTTVLPNFSAERLLTFFREKVAPLVNEFYKGFYELKLNEISAFADRTVGFEAQIEYSLEAVANMDLEKQNDLYSAKAAELEAAYNILLNDYTDLLDQYGTLYLSPEDSLLVEFGPASLESDIAPGKNYVVEIDTAGFYLAIESPVNYEVAKNNAQPVVEEFGKINLPRAYQAFLDNLDSLKAIAEHNIIEFRTKVKYREDRKKITGILLDLKSIPAMLSNVKGMPFIQHGYELLQAETNLNNPGRFSKIQNGLEESAMLMNYFASIIDSGKVANIQGILDDIDRDTGKIDTLFSEVKFRRSKVDWLSLQEGIAPVKEALSQIISTLQRENAKYKEISGQAFEIFQTNSEGVTEYRGGIFPVSIKNPGYIENDVISWEEKK